MEPSAREERSVSQLLERYGASLVQGGHYQIGSGNHSFTYMHVRLALAHDDCADELARAILDEFRAITYEPNVILSWSIGGRILADAIEKYFQPGTIRQIHVDEARRGSLDFYERVREQDVVLLVDDIVTTGETLSRITQALTGQVPGSLHAVAVVVQMGRDDEIPDFGAPLIALAKVPIENWPKAECAKCAQGESYDDFSDASTNPETVLDGLPPEDAVLFADRLARMLRNNGEGPFEAKTKRALEAIHPIQEFPGSAQERIAVFGSRETWKLTRSMCEQVSTRGFHAITTGLIFQQGHADSPQRIGPYRGETISDFRKRIIYSCKAAIIVFTSPAEQHGEVALCREANKPTLGLVQLRRSWDWSRQRCEYLTPLEEVPTSGRAYCGGYAAVAEDRDVKGGWICAEMSGRCPFPDSGLGSDLLDYFNTSPNTLIVGVTTQEELNALAADFAANSADFIRSRQP